jgi:hypothetical protein
VPSSSQSSLSDEERDGIVLAVKSAFTKLKNLYQEITPIIQKYGFTVPSAGVIARDLSERIETSIVQHCSSFSKGQLHCDLQRDRREWEVKICKDSGLTINQSKRINDENYIVVNYKANSQVIRIWILWNAQDGFFSPRKSNTSARYFLTVAAAANREVIFEAGGGSMPASAKGAAAKASLRPKRRKETA